MNQLILNHSKPNTTYRAARKLPQRKRLAVTCPACHFKRLIDTGDATKSKTYQPGEQGYDGADLLPEVPQLRHRNRNKQTLIIDPEPPAQPQS